MLKRALESSARFCQLIAVRIRGARFVEAKRLVTEEGGP
jgi:hypothetical protein